MSNRLTAGSNAVIAEDYSTAPPASEWVNLFGDALFSYAMRYVRRESLAEDLVQDAFVSALQNLSKFEGRSAFKSWLTGILRHKILDYIRDSAREKTEPLSELGGREYDSLFDITEHYNAHGQIEQWDLNPEAAIEQRQFVTTLDSCLAKLNQTMRQVFLLREVEDLERGEICNITGLSPTNVGVVLHRTRLLLRECLEKNWFGKMKEAP